MHFLNSSPTKSLGQAQAVGVRRPWSPRRHDGRRGTVLGRTAGSREFSWPQPSCFLTEPDVSSPRQSPVAVDTSSCPVWRSEKHKNELGICPECYYYVFVYYKTGFEEKN